MIRPIPVEEAREAFELFDKKKRGVLDAKEMVPLLRSLGTVLTNQDCKNLTHEFTPQFSFDQVEQVLQRPGIQARQLSMMEGQVTEAFKVCKIFFSPNWEVLDPMETGEINMAELKHIIRSIGETFTKEEFDELLKLTHMNSAGSLKYEEFVANMSEPHLPHAK